MRTAPMQTLRDLFRTHHVEHLIATPFFQRLEQLLAAQEAVSGVLFPPAIRNDDGSCTIFDVDETLSAALYDLDRLGADVGCRNTIRKALTRLYQARQILEAPPWYRKRITDGMSA